MTNKCSNTTPNSTTHVVGYVIKTSTRIPLDDKKLQISRTVTTDVYAAWYLIYYSFILIELYMHTYCVSRKSCLNPLDNKNH